MKSIASGFIFSLLLAGCSFTVAAEQKKYDIEQWRVYGDSEAAKPTIKAILFSFDGEDGALGLRCDGKSPELYFVLSDRLPAKVDGTLTMKADGVAINVGKWQRASSGNGAFSTAPLPFIRQLSGKQGLILTYQTEQGRYKVAAFAISGIDRVVGQMNAICKISV